MRISKYHFCLVFFSILVTSLFFVGENVHAQAIGIKISPVKVEDTVEPGQVLKGTLKVTNEAQIPKKFFVYLKDFKAGDENGSPVIIAPGSEDGYYLASWIDITSEGVDFKPGEEKLIPYTVKVPNDADPGGYFGGVYFGTQPPRINTPGGEQGAGMAVAQQAGCLFLLRVKGEVYEEAFVRDFTTDKSFYGTPFDVKFAIRIENKGNVHVKPYGAIKISDMFGREKGSLTVNDQGGNILPKSLRAFSTNWSGKYGFGKYTAELGLTYGQSEKHGGQGMQSMVAYQSFWIIPWKIVTPFLIVIAIIFIIFVVTVKLYKDKAIKNAMQKAGVKPLKGKRIKKRDVTALSHMFTVFLVVLILLFLVFMGVYFLFFA